MNRLRELRVAAGKTQDAAAKKFGVSRRTIYSWENDATKIPVAVMAMAEREFKPKRKRK